ncbi:MAG: DoxX family membrane protein [Bacteroidia bacterium]|nr:DoxX family membrane protein [Bacteroidia bacterium]
MRQAKRWILLICRFIFGLTFLFSGFVKAVDPLGTTYKISDYLDAFSMGFFSDLSLLAAFLLIILEFTIGFNLVFGIQVKKTAWIAAAFMLVMTPLTLYLAIADPVSDCGCFGDALVISNWETFYKNLVLDALLVLIFVFASEDRHILSNWASYIIMLIPVLSCLGLELYCYNHLPIIDFRPYKVGNNLPSLMVIPDDAPSDEYSISFIYEKDGVKKEFNLENYPVEDSTWTFVLQNSVLIKRGYVPPIHDFSVQLEDGDITDLILENQGYTFLLVSSKLEKADVSRQKDINALYDYANSNGIAFYCLTSSFHEDVEAFKTANNVKYPIGATDEITLKTIIRSNPGLVLLKAGNVVAKWHYNDLPTKKELKRIIKK